MNPIYIVYIIALAAAGAAASVYFISRDARRPGRAQALGGGFALLLLTEFVLLLYVMGMFVVIWALVASLIAALLLAAVLFILWAREVRWRWAHLPVLAGLVVSCAVLSLGIGMAFLGPSITLMRATQIAEANGFRVLLPGWLPAMKNVEGLINVPPGDAPIMLTWVEALAEPDAGVWLGYNGLDI